MILILADQHDFPSAHFFIFCGNHKEIDSGSAVVSSLVSAVPFKAEEIVFLELHHQSARAIVNPAAIGPTGIRPKVRSRFAHYCAGIEGIGIGLQRYKLAGSFDGFADFKGVQTVRSADEEQTLVGFISQSGNVG